MPDELKPCSFFYDRIEVAKSGCWNWTRSKNSRGYGKACYGGRLLLAHRISYMLYFGPIAPGMVVMHQCDNPACVRPDHLRLGTQSDNMLDCRDKNRMDNKGNAYKKFCKHGHEFTKENTHYNSKGERNCRTCDREWHRSHNAKREVP